MPARATLSDIPRRRALRRMLWWSTSVLVGLIIVLSISLILAFRTDPGRSTLAYAAERLARQNGLELSIGSLTGNLPFDVKIDDLRLSDRDGEFLSLREAHVRVEASALLQGRLVLKQVDLRHLVVERPPVEETLPSSEDSSSADKTFPLSPQPVSMRSLTVSPLVLGSALLGERVTLEISAKGKVDTSTGLDASFSATRLDGDGRIEGRLESDTAFSTLRASLRGETATGGLVSRLIGLPGAPGIDVILDGEGPVNGFAARYRVTAGPIASTEGTILLESISPLAFAVEGNADIDQVLPMETRPMVQGGVSYGFSANMNPTLTLLHLSALRMDSAVGGAEGDLKIRLDDLTVDARLSADLTRSELLVPLVPGLALKGAGVAATFQGPISRLAARSSFWIQDVAMHGSRIARAEATVDAIVGKTVEATVSIEVDGLDLPGVPANALGNTVIGGAKIALVDDRATLSEIHARTGPARGVGEGEVDLRTMNAGLSLNLSHSALEGVADFIESGRLSIDVYASYDGQLLAFQSGGALVDLIPKDPEVAALVSRTSDFWIAAQQTSPTDWRISALDITVGPLSGSGSGTFDVKSETGTADLAVSVSDMTGLDPSGTIGAGDLELAAAIHGGMHLAEIDWSLDGRQILANGIDFSNLAGSGHLRLARAALTGDAKLGVDVPTGRVDLASSVGWDGERLALSDLTIVHLRDKIVGTLALRPDPLSVEGVLEMSVEHLAPYAAVTGINLDGALAANVEFLPRDDKQRVAMRGMVANLRSGIDTVATIERLRLTGSVEDALGIPSIESVLALRGAKVAGLIGDSLELRAKGALSALRLDLKAAGSIEGRAIQLDAAGTIGLGETKTIALESFRLAGIATRIALKQPVRAVIAGQKGELGSLALSFLGGELFASGQIDRDNVDASLSLRDISLSQIADLAGVQGIQGRLNATANLSGPLNSPNGEVDLVLADVKGLGGADLDLPPTGLSVAARMEAGAIDANAALSGIGDVPLVLDLNTRLPGSDGTLPVEAKLAWRGDLGALASTLPIDGNLIGGNASLDLSVAGMFDRKSNTFGTTRSAGTVTLVDGRFENFLAGTLLESVTAKIVLDETRLRIERLDASDNAGGKLNVTGFVDFAKPSRPVVKLNSTVEALTVVRRDDADVQLDAEITIRSMEEQLKVTGTIHNRDTEIRLVGSLPAGVEELVVEEIGSGAPVVRAATPVQTPSNGLPVELDIRFSAPGRIFVRGRGLDSEWGGDLHITGSANKPSIEGAIKPLRGVFDFAGRGFKLGDGGVSFAGGESLEPVLDLSAVHSTTDFVATVNASGPADKPEISLSSEPSYPEDEILALILFGRSTARLSAVEALQLAQSTRTLLDGEPGTLDAVRKAIGVDVLTFGSGAGDGTGRLKAGKYIRDDVYVGVEQGTAPGSSRSVVEWSVTPTITVEGTVGATSQSTIGIQRRWEY
jgi:translocation and assembly module TamB